MNKDDNDKSETSKVVEYVKGIYGHEFVQGTVTSLPDMFDSVVKSGNWDSSFLEKIKPKTA